MNKEATIGLDAQGLRLRAEERVRQRVEQGQFGEGADAERLLHELQVYQIELEMQNEELRAARREAEAALSRYTKLFESAPIGYFVLSEEGTIREANAAGAQLLGLEREELPGKPFSRFLRDDAVPSWHRLFGTVLTADNEEERLQSKDLALKRADNEPLEAQVTASTLTGESRAGLVAVVDITVRKRAEEMVREDGRRKDEFLAVLSHELRNPLAPISNSLFVLDRAGPGSWQARRAHAVIQRQVVHLTRIVDDLLEVNRIARGKVRLQTERIELGELVRRTVDDHQEEFQKNGVELKGWLSPEPFWVDADATRIVQVLGNLLLNAVKFTPRGGVTEVTLHREDDFAVLQVHDTGVGLEPEVRSRLFEPFRQAPQTLERSRGGLGLGLAMVKGLVALHEGAVDAASEGVGKGSTFTVRLPLQESPASEVQALAGEPGASRRILIIEDNFDAAESLKEALALGGHGILTAQDGPSGLALAREFSPEIIICDIGLQGMTGYDVARSIRSEAQLRGSFLIALTGYALPEDSQRALNAGFDRHIAKPADLDKLWQIVSEAPTSPRTIA